MKKSFSYLLFLFLLALAASAFLATPAYADDEQPPAGTDAPVMSGAGEASSDEEGTDASQTETQPVSVQEAETAVVPASSSGGDAPPAEEAAAEEAAAAEALSEVPAGTDVVVVNAEGEALPLATQEAEEIIAFVDPVWCPVGVAPQNGTGGCTNSFSSLKALVDALMAGTAGVVPNTNGVIWIQAGADASTGPIVLDGSDPQLGNMETFSLTLQGGWNGTFGSKVTNPATPSTFTRSISIINWLGDITLSDITISGVTTGSSTNSAALDIETTKKITLNRVNVNNNSNSGAAVVYGAWLDNQDTGTTGSVTVSLSNFSNNEKAGLTVRSNGTVTLSSVAANGNGDMGLYVQSNGAITLSNVTASANSGHGAYLNNNAALTPQKVTLTGVNTFNGNVLDGLSVNTKGAITLNNIAAWGNGWNGAYLDNTAGTGSVTLTGVNTFNGNGLTGLQISSNGVITLSNVTASDNNGLGAKLNNETAPTPKNVTLTGVNTFNGNDLTGLQIFSKGSITLSNITASNNNGLSGAHLDNDTASTPQKVTLTGVNTFNGNSLVGLSVYSNGAITLSNITASDNGGSGAYLSNSGAPTPQNVTLTGFNTFNNNSVTSIGDGLSIYSKGAITLSNVTASGNGFSGAFLDNSLASTPKNVTLTGVNTFSNNGSATTSGDGLKILSKGSITLSNVTAEGNLDGSGGGTVGYGAYLDNDAGTGSVKLTGVNAFNGNALYGLYILSNGAITLNNITASDNGGAGAYLKNDTAPKPQNVTLTGVNAFNGNSLEGLYLLSNGAITLSNVTASNNGSTGALLTNNSASTPKNVTLAGVNTFNGNGSATTSGDGLRILSKGSITLNNVTANSNQDGSGGGVEGYGAYLDNTAGTGIVKLTGANIFNGNDLDGLYTLSNGAITLSNVTASNNNGYGALLDNNSASAPQNVTLTGVNAFNLNSLDGLRILSNGAITLSNVTASDNFGNGAFLNNSAAPTPQKVTVTGANFLYNGLAGLAILSKGNVSVTKSIASFNGTNGVSVNTTGSVTMTCGSYIDNIGYGLVVTGGTAGVSALKLASVVTALNGSGGVDTTIWTGLPPVVTVPACP